MKNIFIITLGILIFTGCSSFKSIQTETKMLENDQAIVFVFFDPACKDCDIDEILGFEKMGVKVDLIHYLEIVKNDKTYGISYLYEAIKMLDSQIAWDYLIKLKNVSDDNVSAATDKFLIEHSLKEKLNFITSSGQIENILAYDKIMAYGLYPSFFVYLSVDPKCIDINIQYIILYLFQEWVIQLNKAQLILVVLLFLFNNTLHIINKL